MKTKRLIRVAITSSFIATNCLAEEAKSKAQTIGILGDSLSTGAVTNPALVFDSTKLWNIFRGEQSIKPEAELLQSVGVKEAKDPLARPMRLTPTAREYFGSADWIGRNLLNTFSQIYLDTEEYSWAYMLGLKLGISGSNVLFAAEDGARMKASTAQVNRLLVENKGTIPNKLFIFFSGNDLCGPTIEYVTEAREFASQLNQSLTYLKRNGDVPEGGTDVYVIGFLGVMQIVTSPEILAKKNEAHGQTLTCKEVADYTGEYRISEEIMKKSPEALYFFRFFPKNSSSMCPTVFGKNFDYQGDGQAAMLANRVREYRKVSREVIEEKTKEWKKNEANIRLHYIDATENLVFEPKDIASDCFHLSIHGHKAVADAVFSAL